jgi:hypothetical protein
VAPITANGINFSKWQLDGTDLTTNVATTVVMDGDHTVTGPDPV